MTRRRASQPHWLDEIRDPRVLIGLDVFEPADPWQDTGLLGPDGQPIRYYTGPNPVGFLWDVPRERQSLPEPDLDPAFLARLNPPAHRSHLEAYDDDLPDEATEVPPLTRG